MKKFITIIILQTLFIAAFFSDSLIEFYAIKYHKELKNPQFLLPLNDFRTAFSKLFSDNSFLQTTPSIKLELSQTQNPKISYEFSCKQYSLNLEKSKEIKSVLLIGDSLMQGTAAAICKQLEPKKIKCINLAKQSTGLLHKKFFDYEKAIKNAAKSDVVVLFAGINDIWPAITKKGEVEFGTNEWKKIFKTRLDEILAAAKSKNSSVFIYEIPSIKNAQKSAKIALINEIFAEYESSVKLLKIDKRLKEFAYYLKFNNKSKRVRQKDGIHFTKIGYSMLADEFLKEVNQ